MLRVKREKSQEKNQEKSGKMMMPIARNDFLEV